MSRTIWIASALVAVVSVAPALAQDADTLSPLEIAVACAIPPQSSPGPSELRLVGAQDTVPRTIFAGRDYVLVGAGGHDAVQVGMRYFVRRSGTHGERSFVKEGRHAVHTAGWIRIVTVNDSTALAVVEHTCGDLRAGDYLEPFVAPILPAGIDRMDTSGSLDFSSPAHMLYGDLERTAAGSGDFVLIDRGEDAGAAAGARFAIFRDLRSDHTPLASVGEAVVVVPGPEVSLVRIVTARDAVFSGDYLVPRK